MEYLPWIVEGTFAISVLGFMYKMYTEMNKRTNAIFRRFDEHKVLIENKLKEDFVSKEMCHIMHDHGQTDFQRLEKKVDDGFRTIDKKMDRILNGRT